MTKRWKKRPEGSTWGDFGVDDQRGRLNLLTPERTLRAVREVQAGRQGVGVVDAEQPGVPGAGLLAQPHRGRHLAAGMTGRAEGAARGYRLQVVGAEVALPVRYHPLVL